jgi:hypothetical protein
LVRANKPASTKVEPYPEATESGDWYSIRILLTGLEVDTNARPRSLVAVSRVRKKLVAACLLAFWLVATQHCGLESVGLFAAHHEEGEGAGCCSSSEGCATDGCATVEDGAYRLANSAPVIPAPLLGGCLWSVNWSTNVPLRELRVVAFRCPFERPLDWLPTWQFVRRAAPSPRAPSLV